MKKLKYILLGLLLLVSTFGNAQWTGIGNRILINQGGGGRPVYISHEVGTNPASSGDGTTVIIDKPSNIDTGDMLIILLANDRATSDIQWSSSTNIVANDDFIFRSTGGNSTTDCHFGIFTKIADGLETSTISVISANKGNLVGFYILIKSGTFNGLGTVYESISNLTSHTLDSPSGPNIDDLGVFILSVDGGDGLPFSVSGTGWTLIDEVDVVGANGVGAVFGIKDYTETGGAPDVTITSALFEGASGQVIRIVK